MKEGIVISNISETRLYSIWANMKQRCYNPKNKFYNHYGGKGIIVCEEWLNDFEVFQEWAYGNGYREYLSIDRINNDKGYMPQNCRWVTQKEQMQNTTLTRFITINGVKKRLGEWSQISGVKPGTLSKRYKNGVRGDRLLQPTRLRRKTPYNAKRITINGVTKSISEWSEESGVQVNTINARLRRGVKGTELIEKPHSGYHFKSVEYIAKIGRPQKSE